MATHGQINKSQRQKWPHFIRIIILIVGLLLLAAGATLWFLSNAHVVDSSWSNILTIIFGILGVSLTFIFWLFPIPANKPEIQQAQQIHNVEKLQQFFYSHSPSVSRNPISTEIVPLHNINETTETALTRKRQTQEYIGPHPQEASTQANSLSENEQRELLPDPDEIFHVSVPLTDPTEYYGRFGIRATLINRTRQGASTSIVGPRRIGKTWLIRYLRLVSSQNLGSNFRVGNLDATSPSCATVSGLTSRAVEELGNAVIESTSIGLETLEQVVKNLRLRNTLPVLCIDEFEGLCNPQFDKSFFTGLRAIAQAGLVLIVASKQPVSALVSDQVKSSPFFNIFEPLTLQPFSAEEAKEFIQDKGRQARFTEQEQSYVLRYGRKDDRLWIPLRLQLVGKMLLEDKNSSVRDNPSYYRPNDLDYWREFEKRLEGKYQGAVGI